jgi:MoxR-like ATPase
MKPSELYEALHALISERVPLHVWGACGVGKSQIVAQVAADRKCDFLDIRAVQLDPVDLRSLPRITADRAEWVPPKFLPLDGEGILFLDELTSAPQMTQAGCYQLVLDRKLGEYRLPDGWVVIAAGNPASERGVHFSMPRPLRNRFDRGRDTGCPIPLGGRRQSPTSGSHRTQRADFPHWALQKLIHSMAIACSAR